MEKSKIDSILQAWLVQIYALYLASVEKQF